MAGPSSSPSATGLLVDRVFRNRRTGRITIVQIPNTALWLFLATVVARRIVTGAGPAHTAFAWAGAVTLGWWALDEVVRGVNPWRRVLGLGGCAIVAAGVVSMAR